METKLIIAGEENYTGFCDKKGQRVPISVGGPSVLLEKLRVIGLPA